MSFLLNVTSVFLLTLVTCPDGRAGAVQHWPGLSRHRDLSRGAESGEPGLTIIGVSSEEYQLWERISRVSGGRQRRRVGKLSGSWKTISLQYCLHLSPSWRHQHFLQDSSHSHLLFLSHNSERIKINWYLVTKRTFKKSNRKSPKESQDSDLSI